MSCLNSLRTFKLAAELFGDVIALLVLVLALERHDYAATAK
jgi:hypothetical protein